MSFDYIAEELHVDVAQLLRVYSMSGGLVLKCCGK